MSVAKSKSVKNGVRRTTKKPALKRAAKPRAAKLAARRRATKMVLPTEIKLSARDSRRLLADLASPPQPNERLKKAAARYKRLTARKQR